MLLNPDIDYTKPDQIKQLLNDIDDTITNIGIRRNFICEKVGDTKFTYSKLISGIDGYVSEHRIRKYCNYINKHYGTQNKDI